MEVIMQFIPLILIFAVFYFLLIRPQQRRAKMHRDMVSAMQRGDKVITAGGLRAKVVKVVNETDVVALVPPTGTQYQNRPRVRQERELTAQMPHLRCAAQVAPA